LSSCLSRCLPRQTLVTLAEGSDKRTRRPGCVTYLVQA
jgi:hypothetical protein